MTTRDTSAAEAVDEGALRRVTEDIFGKRAGAPDRIVQFRRSPSPFSSSYAIEELDLTLESGARHTLVFKNLGKRGLTTEARDNKPEFLFDPRREIEVYDSLLPRYAKGTAGCIGSVMDERRERIAEGLAASDRAEKELETAKLEVDKQIREARDKASEIVDQANQRNRQVTAAEADIAQAANQAREDLRASVAGLAVLGASRILEKEVDADTHRELLDKLIAEI